jgi:hypothetical protein
MRVFRRIPLQVLLWSSLLWVLLAATAHAQVCLPQKSSKQSALQYLRRLSLDLRGFSPSYQEMMEVVKAGKVSDSIIDRFLNSKEFLSQISKYHKDLLWNNILNLRITGQTYRLSGNGTSSPFFIASVGRRRSYRGGIVSCLNEPAAYDANGNIKCKQKEMTAANGSKYVVCQEGYVMISPYWAPGSKVKVCAYDANTAENYKSGTRTISCGASGSKLCGCGPGLRFCQRGNTTQQQILRAMMDQMKRFIETIIKNNEPYHKILTKNEVEVNGPLSHYLRYQTRTGGNLLYALPTQNFEVPTVAFHETTKWVKVQRKTLHSGLLTLPGYLLKFSANRSRANRFYNAFLCKYFEAPKNGLPLANDACHNEPNLMQRCGCKYCHIGVEPAAAYWGRWAEAGVAPLNTKDFPVYLKACDDDPAKSRRNATCRRLYFFDPHHPKEQKYKGQLISYMFATPQMKQNIEVGPRLLAQKAITSGEFASCTTRKMWKWFTGAAASSQQEQLIKNLTGQFKQKNYNLKQLIKAIVTTAEYKQGRLLGLKK